MSILILSDVIDLQFVKKVYISGREVGTYLVALAPLCRTSLRGGGRARKFFETFQAFFYTPLFYQIPTYSVYSYWRCTQKSQSINHWWQSIPTTIVFLYKIVTWTYYDSVKCVQIWNYFWSVFSCFGLNTGKYRPEKIPYLDTFHAAFTIRCFNYV